MSEINRDRSADKPIFVAELTPYRSLSRYGFRVLLIICAMVTVIHGFFFTFTGAWPIALFFGVDFLLLAGAFWLNYRSARAREEVFVSRTDVAVRKFTPSGRVSEYRFNPFWARFFVRRHHEFGILSMHVAGEGRRTDIGSFLNPDDRESFARAFRGALATAKQRI